jgi:hypothetical protein
LNPHLHVVFLDGVFDRDERGRVRFHSAQEPTRGEMEAVVRRLYENVVAPLGRPIRSIVLASAAQRVTSA